MTVETEVLKALKMKQGAKEKRAEFLEAVANKSFEIFVPEEKDDKATKREKDEAWDAMSEEAQAWISAAQVALNDEKKIEDFPDDKGADEPERPSRSRRDEPEEDRRGSRGRADDDEGDRRSSRSREDEDAPRGGRSRRDEPEEDDRRGRGRGEDDERSSRSRRDEPEEDDRRGSRRDEPDEGDSRSSRRGRDEETERPARTSRREADDGDKGGDKGGDEGTTLPAQIKTKIKDLLFETPNMTPDAIIKALNTKTTVSKVAVADIKAEWRHTVKNLQDNKALKKAIL